MKGWLAKVRGIVGLGAIGGLLGALVGGAWTAIAGLLSVTGIVWGNVAFGAIIWGFFGTFSAGGFAVVLASLGSRSSLEELPLWKAGLFGAAAGAVFPLAVVLAVNGTLVPFYLASMLPAIGFCGGLGGFLSSGMVLLAKRAPDTLDAPEETVVLTDGK